ncbi:hypothetical protein O181_029141 [Austropuccinia psidii MF-1]|uniref:Integrase catalytic domain-containing protein n=1 Tax=Austropuccinia psidii MF-1 TaxID=1389203 RepID=A0A9Q3CVW5_9BASI|nr:hypothetical protein [Austropuccinia psidii MF-1]
MRNLKGILYEDSSTVKSDPIKLNQSKMVYYFIVGHLNDKNYDKFVSKDENDPVTLWKNIKDHYASSSAENLASNFGKLFSIKFPSSSSSLSESISLFGSTLRLLRTLSPTLFTGDIMPQALAFYVLRMFPETCRHVSMAVFHSIKVSTKIPTAEEVFKEVELDIIQRSSSEEDDNVALNREAYHKRRNNHLAPGMGVALAACNSSGHLSNQTILDSGFSNTIAPTNRGFLNTTRSKETLLAANGNSMEAVSKGTLCLKTSIGNLLIQKALVVPSVSSKLVSLGTYLNNGATLKGYKGGADLYDKHGKLRLTMEIVNNVLLINTPSPISGNPLRLHKRLGHPSSHCLPFTGTFPIPTQTLEVIHMDLCGPITPISCGGNKYIFQLIDGFSHMRFVYLLKEKADSYHSFLKLQSLVENQTSNTIKIVVSDNGGEFFNHKFSALFLSKGIKHLTTAPYTPQQNPVSEQGNPFVLNQTPIASINYPTCISLWDPLEAQIISDLHPFGCTAIMHCSKENRKSKAFWPKFVSNCSSSSNITKVPSNHPATGGSSKSPSSLLAPNKFGTEGTHYPPYNNSLPPQHPSPPPNVPKGWTFDLVPDEAPKNIESTISSKNIILGKCQTQPPSHFAGAVEGLDFHDTFAPTGCLATLCFLWYCAEKDLDLHQMDIKTALLHGYLNEVIHISLPEGYQPSRSDSANPCFIFIHVDDLVIGSANLDSFQAEINSTFDMKDLGELRFVLAMKVTRNRNLRLIFLTQELYVNKILHTFKMSDCQPASTPQVPSCSLEPVSSDLDSGKVSINFQKAIGLLNYLVTCMCPDLAFSASCLS